MHNISNQILLIICPNQKHIAIFKMHVLGHNKKKQRSAFLPTPDLLAVRPEAHNIQMKTRRNASVQCTSGPSFVLIYHSCYCGDRPPPFLRILSVVSYIR